MFVGRIPKRWVQMGGRGRGCGRWALSTGRDLAGSHFIGRAGRLRHSLRRDELVLSPEPQGPQAPAPPAPASASELSASAPQFSAHRLARAVPPSNRSVHARRRPSGRLRGQALTSATSVFARLLSKLLALLKPPCANHPATTLARALRAAGRPRAHQSSMIGIWSLIINYSRD